MGDFNKKRHGEKLVKISLLPGLDHLAHSITFPVTGFTTIEASRRLLAFIRMVTQLRTIEALDLRSTTSARACRLISNERVL